MFSSIRLKLVASTLMTVTLVCVIFAGALYWFTAEYLAFMADQALRESLANEYVSMGLDMPIELASARPMQPANNTLTFVANISLPNQPAIQMARTYGNDLRTITTDTGENVRLLTHRFPETASVAFIQIGHALTAEEGLLHQLLVAVILISSLLVALSAMLSWCCAERVLKPVEQAWQQQQLFIANTNHELRMPLTLIQANTDVALRQLEPNHAQRYLLEDVRLEVNHMSKMISDLLVVSSLDSHQIKLDLHILQMSDELSLLKEQIAALAQQRGISLRVDEAKGSILADPTRLRQILLNVLDNAIRHTPRGGTVGLNATTRGDKVHITISDTGEGIPAEALPHVFQRFYRAEDSRNNRKSIGLGLSITRMLVQLHAGHIDISSTLGHGTLVTIVLPTHTPVLAHQLSKAASYK